MSSPDASPRRLPAGRKAELAAFVTDSGEVTVAQLAERFEVSADTIRRDLDQLDTEGVLVRTHGGAVGLAAAPRPNTELDVRMRLQTHAKEQIGSLAAGLVRDGQAIIVNAGTTALATIRALSDHRDLTVATNSLRGATELNPVTYRDLYVFGGAVRITDQATLGPVRFPSWNQPEVDIRCDLALIGVGAVSPDVGYSTSNLVEASMMSEMMERADTVAILADSSKFSRRLFAQIATLDRADYLVTDSAPPTDLRRALDEAGVEVLLPPA
ncbi:DeoR/GlpR family DNA-binding transcription regulator [Cellulomonas sp. RIT-PI-Y]|uniref:DeoR/GlpR family DNA-binding transcription regulator n=1 Tax=Cellulomonas sp. RIT-PI-Y TaxID=3035297 RepID=UPI0021DB6B9B|nr:DeoR/GlpR family DNA-binding transcription regulator [Cellulomonas sp. RIT-PI-Y]